MARGIANRGRLASKELRERYGLRFYDQRPCSAMLHKKPLAFLLNLYKQSHLSAIDSVIVLSPVALACYTDERYDLEFSYR
jgi:hypothetical protein